MFQWNTHVLTVLAMYSYLNKMDNEIKITHVLAFLKPTATTLVSLWPCLWQSKCYPLHAVAQDWAYKLQRASSYTMMSFKPQSICYSNWSPASMWPWPSQFVYTVTHLTENQYQIVSFLSSSHCLKWIDSTVSQFLLFSIWAPCILGTSD